MVLRKLIAALTGRRPMQVPDYHLPTEDACTTTDSGLQHECVVEGTGATPGPTDKVTVHYAGWLTDGTPFDSSYSRGQSISFPLNGVIAGWTEGLQLMKVGGTSRFVIPAKLAYGDRGAPPVIGPGATLVFQVELLGVG